MGSQYTFSCTHIIKKNTYKVQNFYTPSTFGCVYCKIMKTACWLRRTQYHSCCLVCTQLPATTVSNSNGPNATSSLRAARSMQPNRLRARLAGKKSQQVAPSPGGMLPTLPPSGMDAELFSSGLNAINVILGVISCSIWNKQKVTFVSCITSNKKASFLGRKTMNNI